MIASLSRGSLLDEVLHGGSNEQQQLAAYVSWVNAQLRKKPGLKPITDLRLDLQDGVVLVHLIEIVAGEVLEGVHVDPLDREERRKNVEKVLQFIASRHIRMPHISARDIVDGNLKTVMRIILALAAHFKPSASHRAAAGRGRGLTRGSANHNPLSPVALAQGAAAALASARLDASQPVRCARIYSGWSSDVEKSVSVRTLVEQYEKRPPDELVGLHTGSLSPVSPLASPRVLPSSAAKRPAEQQQQIESCDAAEAWDSSLGDALEQEVQDTRKMVSALQALLLHGSLPEDEQDASLDLEQGSSEQQVVVVRSRLDQSMEENQELRRELLRCKQEMRNLQAVKEAQQQRLCTQEASILQMKQELLRASMAKDEHVNKNAELQWKLEECIRLRGECKKEMEQKDRLVQQLKHKLEETQGELQKELQFKINMQIPTGTEKNNGYSHSGDSAPSMSDAEEVQLLRDSLRSLRNNFREQDPEQHTLDTLEQGIVSLMDRLHVLHTHRERGKSPRRRGQPTESDTWSCTKVSQCRSSSSASTKILYYTGKSPTPSMINIPKRLGEVTLRDVKAAVDREGNYRYHFKALDPEFGTVKEEVFQDGAIIPGWEGKIVAWVEEEDCGDERPF